MAKKKNDDLASLRAPYVQAALLCDSFIEGTDGALSFIRVIDRVALTGKAFVYDVEGTDLSDAILPTAATFTIVVGLKKFPTLGDHVLTIEFFGPTGESASERSEVIVSIKDETQPLRGANLLLPAKVDVSGTGSYFFQIGYLKRELARVYFHVDDSRERIRIDHGTDPEPGYPVFGVRDL